MKNRSFLYLSAVAFALTVGTVGCSGPTQMTPSGRAPFTEGEVDASYKQNGNGSVTVRVKNLGDASKLKAGATTYVVWLTPDGTTDPQNAGAMQVNGDMEGELEFKTPFQKFSLVVTPEPTAEATSMTGAPVLKANIVAD